MNKENLQEIRCMGHNFVWACCLMGVLGLAGGREESVVAVDMQECAGVEEGATELRPRVEVVRDGVIKLRSY